MGLQGPAEGRLGGLHVALLTQPAVHRVALAIDSALQIHPAPAQLQLLGQDHMRGTGHDQQFSGALTLREQGWISATGPCDRGRNNANDAGNIRSACGRPLASWYACAARALTSLVTHIRKTWMKRRSWFALVLSLAACAALADVSGPEGLVNQLSNEVLEAVRSDKAIQDGDQQRVIALVDAKVMPYVNAERMTAIAAGRYWRQATPEQQRNLQEQFKLLLVRTYAGALSQVGDQTVQIKPSRGGGDDSDVVVRTLVKGKSEPVQLDYRLEKTGASWKVYDINVLGVWLAENYRNSFAQEIGASGIDGLIAKLSERNKAMKAK
jgi:phospholipid transport system substrate-binding protein